MTTKIQMCNRALSTYLGHPRINNLTEDSVEAEQCNLHYDDTLKALFEMDDWVFTRQRQTLAVLTNDREDEWLYRYARPTNALMIRWVNDPNIARLMMQQGETPDTDRHTTASNIYSDVENAVCAFNIMELDTTLYPQYFADAFSAMLAAAMAMPLTESMKRAEAAESQAAAKIDHAMAQNELNTPPVELRRMPDHLKDRGITL